GSERSRSASPVGRKGGCKRGGGQRISSVGRELTGTCARQGTGLPRCNARCGSTHHPAGQPPVRHSGFLPTKRTSFTRKGPLASGSRSPNMLIQGAFDHSGAI